MWPPPVVVRAVPSEDGPQVPFTEDQDAVGELGSGGQDESFGEAVRSRALRRDLDSVDPDASQDGGRPRGFRTASMGPNYAAICALRCSSRTSLGVR
jgi:hypothetical protein